jgi:hypothetical protein
MNSPDAAIDTAVPSDNIVATVDVNVSLKSVRRRTVHYRFMYSLTD